MGGRHGRPFLLLGRFGLGRRLPLYGDNRRATLLEVHHHLQDDGFPVAFHSAHQGIGLVEHSRLHFSLEVGAGRAGDPRNQRGE